MSEEHIKCSISDFNERFCDLERMKIPSWVSQTFVADLSEAGAEFQQELCELQVDEAAASILRFEDTMIWLKASMKQKNPRCTSYAAIFLIHFPSSYLVECGFSAVNFLIEERRNRLDIVTGGDLRLKMTELVPDVKKTL